MDDSDFCMECGCTEIAEANIEEWERMYERRYGHKYVERNSNVMRAKIYGLTLGELKQAFHDSPYSYAIMYSMYPQFPRYLTGVEATLLFFDKVFKDGRLDELREMLIEKTYNDGREEQES